MNNDLISREALKKAIIKRLCISSEKYLLASEKTIYDEIDNAPTVEPIKQCKYCKYCGNEEYCSNCHSDHSLFEYYKRPQGEWNEIQSGMLICPFCGAMPHKLYKNYCAKCGANLRKGEEE